MNDAYWERSGDYEDDVRKGPESARAVYRELSFLLGVGAELSPQARRFLAERLWQITETDDCAESLGLKKERKRPPMTIDERNRFLVEMEVLISVYGLNQDQASLVLGEYHHRERSKFKKLRTKYPETARFIRQKVTAGHVLAWSKLPDDFVRLISDFFPDHRV